MGADELAAALHAPLRSELSSLWGDDDAAAVAVSPSSASSSSAASSPALPPQTQHQPLAAPSFFLSSGDLNTFLTSAATLQQQQQQQQQSTPTPNFLDDLLSSTDDLDFRVRGGNAAASSAATATSNGHGAFPQLPLTHSLPPSIQQQLMQSLHAQRQLAAAGLGSLSDLELDGSVDAAQLSASLRGATASRLLQLENNYERKKKRAKINRKDLNARFQELMDILNLKEDRKLNRAKVLEKTIEYIERLEDELHVLRAQADPKKATHPQQQQQQQTAAQMLLPTTTAASGAHTISGNGSLVAFNPSGAHAWAAAAAAGASSLPMPPMMWLPCPVVAPPPSNAALRGTAAQTATRVRIEKRSALRGPKVTNVPVDSPATAVAAASASTSSAQLAPATSSTAAAEGTRRSLKRTREGAIVSSVASEKPEHSVFVWSAQEIPTLLAFCDAWTLVRLMQTSKEVAAVAGQDKLWQELSRQRWWLSAASQMPNAREQWVTWHREMRLPECGAINPSSTRFASGRAQAVDVWGLLARRSNGRTTRTVLVGGKAAVMQVVELYVVVQNMGQHAVRLSDDIRVGLAAGGGDVTSVAPFTAASGAHLTPHVVALNGGACVTRALESVVLRHGDVCVLDVFLECPGLDLEQEFLQRTEWLDVRCVAVKDETCVAVRARCAEGVGKKPGGEATP